MTVDFYSQAEEWTECHNMPDDRLAAKIKADRIDILVDLSGHSKGNRLKTFALRPAPIQVTGWGHPTGTGLSSIDYLMTERYVIPEERRHLFAEKCWDLPYFLPFEPTDIVKTHPILPRSERPFTFGSLNRLSKISDRTLRTWAKILRRAKDTRLFLKDYAIDTGSERDKIWAFFKAEGVDPARIEMRGGSTKADHLAAYNNVDLALDPFPQSGGTTSFEAIYMGVPVLAMAGASVSARGSASIMLGLGFSGLVAESEPVYIDMAVKAAKWPPGPRGEELRALLMSRHGDGKAYCRAVETAYRAMWKEWCDGAAGH